MRLSIGRKAFAFLLVPLVLVPATGCGAGTASEEPVAGDAEVGQRTSSGYGGSSGSVSSSGTTPWDVDSSSQMPAADAGSSGGHALGDAAALDARAPDDGGTQMETGIPSDAGPPGTPVGVHGRLHVEGNKIVDAHGNPVTLHGMSMYDWSRQGQQFYNTSAVGNLSTEMKCAALRVPLNPSNYPGAVNRIKTVIDACIANGTYCILDWHPGGSSNVTQASAYFVEMAQAYHGVPNVMYEPWNETPSTTPWSSIKAYHEQVLAAVRPIEPDAIFILGNRAWDQNPQEAAADPVNDPNVAYTVHFYANSHPLSAFQPHMDATLNKGFPIFVTEYGGVSANGNGTFNVAETQKWWTYLDAHDIGSTNWAVETNGETSSVFVGNASATGPWTDADLTNSGKIVFPYIESKWAATVMP
jgi:endoglucanase